MGRFFRRGTSQVKFALDVADPTSPTDTEVNDADDLSNDIAEINGFELSNSPISTPNLQDTFTPQIEGEDTVADSGLVLYDRTTDGGDTSKRDVFSKGDTGYILLLPYGNADGERMEVWPVVVTGVNDEWTVGNEPARFNVSFAVSEPPEQNATVPTAA